MIVVIVILFLFCLPTFAKDRKIRGYITNISSPTQFDIEDYRITRDATSTIDFEKDDLDQLAGSSQALRVGSEIELVGAYNEGTRELKATHLKVFLKDNEHVKRTALIERRTMLEKSGDIWRGTIRADGQRIVVGPETMVSFKTARSQDNASSEVEAMSSSGQIPPNTLVTFDGMRQSDGTIRANKLDLMPHLLVKGEMRLMQSDTTTVKRSRDDRPAELRIKNMGRFRLVPNPDAQEYVRMVGNRLIPEYQRLLSTGNPGKIAFQFFLVKSKVPNAYSLPNGTVVVHSSMLEVLENEAQLAMVLGHEIAHATQEHMYRERQYHKKKLMALQIGTAIAAAYGKTDIARLGKMVEGLVRNGYSRSLENQADRIGMEYVVAAGYDPREGPRIWKLMAQRYGDRRTDVFWDNHDNHTTRRSYLMAELRNNYADLDQVALVKNEAAYRAITGSLYVDGSSHEAIRIASRDANAASRTETIEVLPRPKGGNLEGFRASTSERIHEDARTPMHANAETSSVAQTIERAQPPALLPQLTIDSVPTGANVKLNGLTTIVGQTPFLVQTGAVGFGFSITIEKDGYRPYYVQTFSVPGSSTLKATLDPLGK